MEPAQEHSPFIHRALAAVAAAGLLAIVVLAFSPIRKMQSDALAALQNFRAASHSFYMQRTQEIDMRVVLEARRYIPPGAKYGLSLTRHSWSSTRARYLMYPNTHQTDKDWDYFIDVTGKIPAQPGWKTLQLSTGKRLYARHGMSFNEPPLAPFPDIGLARPLLLSGAVFLLMYLLGAGFLGALRIPVGWGGVFWWHTAAWLLGFTLVNLALWLLVWAGVPFQFSYVLPALIMLATAALVLWIAGFQYLRVAYAPSAFRAALPDSFAAWAAILSAAYVAALFIVPIVLRTAWGFDALSHWLYKAQGLVHHGGFGYMADTNVNQYPMLWTMNAALMFLISGGPYDEMTHWAVAAMVVALLGQLCGAMTCLRLPRVWIFGLLALFLLCFNEETLQTAYAESALLAYSSALLAALLMVQDKPLCPRALAFVLLCGLGVAGIKLEGAVTLLILAATLLLTHAQPYPKRGAWLLAAAVLLPISLTVGWQYYVGRMGHLDQTHMHAAITWPRLQLLWTRLLDSTAGNGAGWRVGAGILLVTLLWRGLRWTRDECFLALVALSHLLFIYAALVGWKTAHIDKSTMTASPRLALHAAPMLLLFAGLRWRRMQLAAQPPPLERVAP